MMTASIWVVLLHFSSGAIEPTFAYAKQVDCQVSLDRLLVAGKSLHLTGECVEFKPGDGK